MFREYPSLPWTKLYSTNQSGSTITKPTPTTTAPTGNGIIDLLPVGRAQTIAALIAFYGTRTSADNETMTARITTWRKLDTLWIPVPQLALSITLGAATGVAGASIVNTEFLADTITASTAFAGSSSYEIISPIDDTIAMVKLDAVGAAKVQVQIAKGTCATCNAIASGF